ncbi:MAG: fibronectin type III domain-containing protein [Gallionella sp.]
MKNINARNFKRSPIALAVALTMVVPLSVNQAQAGAGWGDNADMVNKVPTYFATSPTGLRRASACFDLNGRFTTPVPGGLCDSGTAIRKFVNPLPLPEVSGTANAHVAAPGSIDLGQYIPIALPQKWVNTQGVTTNDDYYEIAVVEHSEQLHSDLPKATRMRKYVQLETAANAATSRHIALTYPDGTPILDVNGAQVFAYDNPHYLGPLINATKGVATRIKFTNYLPYGLMQGAGHFLPVDNTLQGTGTGPDGITRYTENRVSFHLHGSDAPWVSAGTTHQWFAPAGETAAYAAGMGKGASAANVPDMPDPGPGSYNLYYPNNQSGRFMWYHDQANGITRLNVYGGMKGTYMLSDPTEANMVANGVLPAEQIPLVIQDVTFVPKDVAQQDANWDTTHWGQYGDLWFPHVWEINQDPNSISGWNPVGRWDWGPWFWPVFPAQYSIPSGLYGDVTLAHEAYLDSMMVNGAVFPTMNVEPKAYRLRFMNTSSDRYINLGFYVADTTSPEALAIQAATGVLGAEVPIVPFTTVQAALTGVPFPDIGGLQGTGWGQMNSLQGHPAGVPDPRSIGPNIVQIGTNGGLLPRAVDIPSTIINYEWNRRSISVSNFMERGLLLAGGETADTVVDFTAFAGKTLILWNDAPNMVPAGDPRNDYYSNDPDQTGQGGADTTVPGYAPNTRTVLRVVVAPAVTTPSNWLGLTNLLAAIPAAYAASGQEPPPVPQIAYNDAFGTTAIDNFMRIANGSAKQTESVFSPAGAQTITSLLLVDSGGWYATMPTVVFTPPGGSTGSGATAVVGASLGGIDLTNPGAGYTAVPTVVFSGGTYPDGRVIDWVNQTPADLANFGALPTAVATLSPVVITEALLHNAGKATIALTAATLGPIRPTPVSIAFTSPTTFTVTGGVANTNTYVSGGPITITPAAGNPYTVTITNGATGPVAGDHFSITDNHRAGTIASIDFIKVASFNQQFVIPGSFKTIPDITVTGGGATVPALAVAKSSGRLNSLTLTNPGVGYNATPLITFVGGGGIGATAKVTTTASKAYTVRMKGIQELYELTYGRLNSGFSIELPFTTMAVQTTVPLAFIDPVSETIADGEIQIWKINHNGLFTHPIYFNHLDVQLINRTGWDGTVKPPYENEYGWTDVVHCNQLEDVYVAVRAKKQPTAGFGVPENVRMMDPTQVDGAVGSLMGFTQVDLRGSPIWSDPNYNVNYGLVMPGTVNGVANYDNEFTWYNTMLSFLGNDFMRPISYHPFVIDATVGSPTLGQWVIPGTNILAVPSAPALPAVTISATGNRLSWVDNSSTEYQFNIMRAPESAPGSGVAGAFVQVGTGLANTNGFTDTTAVFGTAYFYRIDAVGAKGISPSAVVALAVAAPGGAPVASSVTATGLMLSWSPVALATSYVIYQNGVALPTVAYTPSLPLSGLTANTAYSFTVVAVNATGGILAQTPAVSVTTVPATPAAPIAVTVGGTAITLSWPAVAGATSYAVYQDGMALPAVAGAATARGVTGLLAGTSYRFTVSAIGVGGESATSAPLTVSTTGVPAVPAVPTASNVTATGVTVNWQAVAGATSYTVYQNGVALPAVAGTATSRVITGLTTGLSYSFSVTANNASGNSARSGVLNFLMTTGLVPSNLMDTEVTLSWPAVPGATDYSIYQDGVFWYYQMATAGTSLVANGLLPETTYAFNVVWGTPSGNSARSAPLNVTTLPMTPAAPLPGPVTSTSAVLTWPAIAGATSYTVYQDGVALPSVAGLTTTATGLTPGATYNYTLAYTKGGATTLQSLPLPVVTMPATPAAPVGSALTGTGLTLSWPAATGATGYVVYQNGVALGAVAAPTMTVNGLTAGATYSFTVAATTTGVASPQSLPYVTRALPPTPTTAAITSTGLTLNWAPVAGATGYTVYQNGVALPAVAGTGLSRVITGLVSGVTYNFRVAYSAPGVSLSAPSLPVTAVPPPLTLGAPTAAGVTSTSVTLNWVPQAANVGVNTYTVYMNGAVKGVVAGTVTSFTVTGLTAASSYNFRVAYSNAGGLSAPSAHLTVVTPAAGVALPAAPLAPTSAAVTSTGFTLNWTAVAGATGYTVYQNGVALPAVAGVGVTRAVTGLTAGTSYTYTVAASNAAGSSAQSPVLTVTTAAAGVPVIAAPTATAVAATSLTLNWTAVAGATSYVVYKNGVMQPLVAGTGLTRAMTGLTSRTSYNFRVAYKNAAGVLSAPSAPLTVVTP